MKQRGKITITLRQDILKRIDEAIDGKRIRNRSHAIEYLLSQSLAPPVKTALILAGGKGVRMKPVTQELPKLLLPVQGRPIIEHQIELLRTFDIRDLFLLVGYLSERIKLHLGDGGRFGVKIRYIEQAPTDIETGYALFLARDMLSETPFLLLYGDVLAQINLKDFIEHHTVSNVVGTVALTSLKYPSLYGVVRLRGQKIVEFLEKPKEDERLPRVVSAGIFCLEPKIFDYLSAKPTLSLEKEVFPKLAKEEQLNGYLFEGNWFDIGTPEIYARAIKEWGR